MGELPSYLMFVKSNKSSSIKPVVFWAAHFRAVGDCEIPCHGD